VNPDVCALEEENERLKRIIAKQGLEWEVKSEPLKRLLSNPRKDNAGQAIFEPSTSAAIDALDAIIW
jgi:hypothetical protein